MGKIEPPPINKGYSFIYKYVVYLSAPRDTQQKSVDRLHILIVFPQDRGITVYGFRNKMKNAKKLQLEWFQKEIENRESKGNPP